MSSRSATSTAGTKMRSNRSVNCCVGAFCVCASSTSLITRSRVRSPAARVVAIKSAPSPLTVPANTSSPGALSTGTDSPVIGAWFTAELPARTTPSTGIRSAGRTTTVSPAATCSTGTSTTCSPRMHAGDGRGEIGQRADGAAGTAEGVVLQRVGEGEEEEQERPLHPLAEHGRAYGGQQHQQVDVERQPTLRGAIRASAASGPSHRSRSWPGRARLRRPARGRATAPRPTRPRAAPRPRGSTPTPCCDRTTPRLPRRVPSDGSIPPGARPAAPRHIPSASARREGRQPSCGYGRTPAGHAARAG